MLALFRSHWRGLLALILALGPGASSPATTPQGPAAAATSVARRTAQDAVLDATDAVAETPDAALGMALELERGRRWSEAIDLYESALRRWPSRTELRHRLRLCETHYRLGRRYEDRSFREVLLRLPHADALDLYMELIERIEDGYVEPVRLEPLLRHGFDNLEVALRDPTFLAAHRVAELDRADRVRWLRDAYRSQREQVAAPSRREARDVVEQACDLGRRALGLSDAAVILEFVYGACDALDNYSGCLTPDKLADLYAEIDGNFVGIGVELKQSPRGLLMAGVIAGGPAAESGLKVGEEIVEVDGRSIAGLGLDAAAATLQGVEHSTVVMGVRNVEGALRRVRLTRRPVEVRSVESATLIDGDVGYLRLIGFQKTTVNEMEEAVADLRGRGMRTLILDLRGNPGGLLNVAVELADRFLDHGRIVATRGRAPGQTFDYSASTSRPWEMPTIVLIDGDSASASEILAGALKDHGRALVVGQRSYGKGSVQSIYPLRSADAALKLTTAKFYSPRDRPYSEQGVTPDVEVATTARPADLGVAPMIPPIPFGDPERDPALRVAIRRAHSAESVAAGPN